MAGCGPYNALGPSALAAHVLRTPLPHYELIIIYYAIAGIGGRTCHNMRERRAVGDGGGAVRVKSRTTGGRTWKKNNFEGLSTGGIFGGQIWEISEESRFDSDSY